MTEPRSWVVKVDWVGRPLLVNAAYGMNHWERKRRKAEWRDAGARVAQLYRLPRLAAAEFRIQGHYPNGTLPDPSGVSASFKGLLDGMVDAGLLPKDTGEFVRAETYIPSVIVPGCRPALVVKITEVLGESEQ